MAHRTNAEQVCKTVYTGSIPVVASNNLSTNRPECCLGADWCNAIRNAYLRRRDG